ncbi:AraC family ligand binding domain-containing protein, partial [Pseudactinotalea sp.]|uniref:AraC family ligand binding domain-containing protein n=1 Tax=Pseudactinotalea sp. TaxID=1926260 RepID=UPI003B3A81CB
MEDSATRAPLTLIPDVDRISAGQLTEHEGYRVLRPVGTGDYLLIATLDGEGRFGMVGHDDVIASAGDVVLLPPGVPHDYGVTAERGHWRIAFAHVHPRPEWAPLLTWPQAVPGIGRVHLTGAVRARARDSLLDAGYYSRSGQPRAAAFAMNALEAVLLWCDTANPSARQLDERIMRTLEHVDAHLSEPLTVRQLAGVARLSVSRFAHLFTEQLGSSPSAYVEQQRMAMAKQLLDLTRRSVADIAGSVG